MAPRATRSASRKARAAEAVATGPLGALSHDELGVIFDGLADPLQPVVAVAFSSTCLGLRTPLRAALEVLRERRGKAEALCRKLDCVWIYDQAERCGGYVALTCGVLRDLNVLGWHYEGVTADHMATLGMIIRTNGLTKMRELRLNDNAFGDPGMVALFDGMGRGAAPSLKELDLGDVKFGPAGAMALAAALSRGAMPKLEGLIVSANPIGNQGIAALAAPLRKLSSLESLFFDDCSLTDEGVATLLDDLGKDDYKSLRTLWLNINKVTDKGMATLVSVIDGGGLPKLGAKHNDLDHLGLQGVQVELDENDASAAARNAVYDALARRGGL